MVKLDKERRYNHTPKSLETSSEGKVYYEITIIIIIIIINHELGIARPVLASSNKFFKVHPIHLRSCGL
jgi:hypothetical protein